MLIQPASQTSNISSNTEVTNKASEHTSTYQQAKKMQNVAILSAAADNSAANNPMQLLYKTAIEEINKQLASEGEENTIQATYESAIDVSPEATAERIVQNSTAFYQAFKEQNSELSDEESLNEFLSVINSGINKGFDDAKGILESLSVLDGDIESNIEQTYDFVQKGLITFKEQVMADLLESGKNAGDSVDNPEAKA